MARIRLGLYISKASQFVRENHNVSYRRLTHLGLIAQRDHGAVALIQQSHDALKEAHQWGLQECQQKIR